jgi:hypothetical protein
MNEEMNRYVCEKLGLCWHITEGMRNKEAIRCLKCQQLYFPGNSWNPDFSTDAGAVQLLRLMMGRKDWWVFRNKYGDEHRYNEQSGEYDYEPMIPINLITTPSALLKACYAWFKEGEK